MDDLDPVDRITTGAIGEPGSRTFYLQGRKGAHVVTLLCEKQQVELLAASVLEIMARLGQSMEGGAAGDELELEEPVDPEWRIGRLALGYDEGRDMFLLEVEELVPDEEEEEPSLEGGRVRFWATRDQMLGLARRGAAVAAAGRPRCELCGNPLDPDGHICPALDGHRGEA